MTSGLVGLSRLEWIPVLYSHRARIQKEEKNKKLFEKAYHDEISIVDEHEKEWEVNELSKKINEIDQSINKREKRHNKLEETALLRYKIHKWAFVLGIVSLVISRTILSLTNLFMKN